MRRIAAAALLLACLLGFPAGSGRLRAQVQGFPQGVAAGDATPQAVVLWTRTGGPAPLWVEFSTNGGFAGASSTNPFYTTPDADYTAKVELTGLQPGQRYFYRFVSGSARSVSGTFVTPPALDRDEAVTVIWGADTAEDYRPFPVFRGMRARNADLFLYLGDTVYSDFGRFRAIALEQYRQKYQINREDLFLREYLTTIATWVVWDDHEVENNFDSEHIRLEIGLRAFREYWPIRPSADAPGRLYRSFRWGRTAEFFILDTRQHRTPAFRFDGPEKTMLGRAQKQWLLDGLARSDALVKVVASTVPLRHHSGDSWEGYVFERNEILRFIAGRRITNVIFLAADVHYAALLHHPEGPYEAISGPLAAILSRSSRVAGKPETLWSATRKFNYGWMRIARDGITLEWRDDQDALMHQARLPVTR